MKARDRIYSEISRYRGLPVISNRSEIAELLAEDNPGWIVAIQPSSKGFTFAGHPVIELESKHVSVYRPSSGKYPGVVHDIETGKYRIEIDIEGEQEAKDAYLLVEALLKNRKPESLKLFNQKKAYEEPVPDIPEGAVV